ncbi:hypothetical protein [Actinocorallia aurantiaca]|uniref:Uncharacterized protein n=1 Tax=Actinocorallia aurantiaca TaxID=46204 RepID=A0ABP6GIG5_9ACTN
MHVEFSTRGSLGPRFLPRLFILGSEAGTSAASWFISDDAGMGPAGSVPLALLPVYGHMVAYLVSTLADRTAPRPGGASADALPLPTRLAALEAELAELRSLSDPAS